MELEILFDSKRHKYTDNFGNAYTSVTTVIGNYEYKFEDEERDIAKACEKIGKNPLHPKYLRYKGLTASQILANWNKAKVTGQNIGNATHGYLEDSVNYATGFISPFAPQSGRLFTIKDLISNPNTNIGRLNLDYFIKTGVKDKYPKIYKIIEAFVNSGWEIYSEICVYDYNRLIAGLIDILLINGDKFVILDWKTNKAPIRFESGYYDKDNDGNITNYIFTEKKLRYPLHNLPQSTGIKYTLQLSKYAWLAESFGLVNQALILCHIRHDYYTTDSKEVITMPDLVGKQVTDILPITYMKDEIISMVDHFCNKQIKDKPQLNLFKR
jgi:hypothetical protein